MGLPGGVNKKYPPPATATDFRFTVNHGALYATSLLAPEKPDAPFEVKLRSFRKGHAHIERVTLLDGAKPVRFTQTDDALICQVPPLDPTMAKMPFTLKVEGAMSSFGV
jgi:hypothetical protein